MVQYSDLERCDLHHPALLPPLCPPLLPSRSMDRSLRHTPPLPRSPGPHLGACGLGHLARTWPRSYTHLALTWAHVA